MITEKATFSLWNVSFFFFSNEHCMTVQTTSERACNPRTRKLLKAMFRLAGGECAHILSSSSFFSQSHLPLSPHLFIPLIFHYKLELLLSPFDVFQLSLGQTYWRKCLYFTFSHCETILVTLWFQDLANDWVPASWMAVQKKFFVVGGVRTCTACREAVGAPCWIFKRAHLLFPSTEHCTFGPCLIVEASAQSSPALWGLQLILLKVLLLFSFVTSTKRGIGMPGMCHFETVLPFWSLKCQVFHQLFVRFSLYNQAKPFLLFQAFLNKWVKFSKLWHDI